MLRRPALLVVAIVALAVVLAIPVLAAKPSTPPGQAKDKPAKAPITLQGTIEKGTDADGAATYTLADGGTTYTLEAGPHWFFDEGAYPLETYVGDDVTVEGEVAAGSTEVEVISVNGTALREAGKPPWAGGWRRVGERHPGWSQEKADRMKAKFGDCFPPGQCKDKGAKPGGGASDDEESKD
jgi:hypothetical protein